MKGNAEFIRYHPGEGRGPVGKVAVTGDRVKLATFPNWAPAFAGVVYRSDAIGAEHNPHLTPS